MEFKASLASEHFKTLSATLDGFSHLGEIVSIEIHNEQLVLCTFNSSRTAQAVAHISRDQFKDYRLLRKGSPDTILRCTISNKNFNSIFKKNLGAIKLIKECQIHITQGNSDPEHHVESRIYMKLIYQNGVTKKNTLWYYDGDPITLYYERQYSNNLMCHPLLLKGYLTRFDPRITEVAIICTPIRVILQSHWDTNISHTGELPVRATFIINASDFDSYSIKKPVKLICNIREFRAIVDYMEVVDGKMNLSFEDAGMPILNKLFIQDKLLVQIALQTLPKHLYDNQTVEEDSSYVSINTNGLLNLDYTGSLLRSHTTPESNKESGSVNHENSNQNTNPNNNSNPSYPSSPNSVNRNSYPSSSGSINRNNHNLFNSLTNKGNQSLNQENPSSLPSTTPQENSSSLPSTTPQESSSTSNSSSIERYYRVTRDEESNKLKRKSSQILSSESSDDTLPFISSDTTRLHSAIIPHNTSEIEEEPLFSRQTTINKRQTKTQQNLMDMYSSPDCQPQTRLSTLEKLRLKRQQKSQQNQ